MTDPTDPTDPTDQKDPKYSQADDGYQYMNVTRSELLYMIAEADKSALPRMQNTAKVLRNVLALAPATTMRFRFRFIPDDPS